MATDPYGAARYLLMQRMGDDPKVKVHVEKELRTNPTAYAMFQVAVCVIAELSRFVPSRKGVTIMPTGVLVTAQTEVSFEQIANAIVGSFEGGSGDWINQYDYKTPMPPGVKKPQYGEESFWRAGGRVEVTYDNPDGEGHLTKEFGLPEIEIGLTIMAQKYPTGHFADLVNENDDAITHDVFMQCVVLGDVIYG